MIPRDDDLREVTSLLKSYPVVGIVGARQVGKTTLARAVGRRAAGPVTYYDLEDPAHRAALAEPMLVLENKRGLVIVDEVQHAPGLFMTLRVLADRPRRPARFLVLGSAAPGLLKQESESLAGRIGFHELGGLQLGDVGPAQLDRLWLRGGFPRAYTSASLAASSRWRRDFIRTFLERDLPQLGLIRNPETMRRFWAMLAHYHGQTWNSSEFARAFGVADTTVRAHLDVLTSAFVVRQMLAWHENIGKRQVKAPKVYVSDSGLLHTLLDLETMGDLETHVKVGASWEGFIIEQLTRRLEARREECYYWATHGGAELDLLVVRGRRKLGFEVKRTTAPSVTRSMQSALADLKLERLDVIHAGRETFPLSAQVRAVSAFRIGEDIMPLRR